MIYSQTKANIFFEWNFPPVQWLGGFIFVCAACCLTVYAQTTISVKPEEKTVIVEDAPELEVLSFGKTVVVKKEAKGVFSFGGDVIIEGRVSGDVATMGGTIFQKEDAFIGGAVMAFGGSYKPESKTPLRGADAETVMYAGYEEELRNLSQNPGSIFSPAFSWSFLALRFLGIPFWFIISFAFTTLSPGAVSRAVARLQLSAVKIVAVGFSAFVATTLGAMASVLFLPNYVNAIVGLMLFVFLILAYVFGRVALQVSVGKRLQKYLLPERFQSETVAVLIGVIVWTILLSIPYLLAFALLFLLSASTGLILTARSSAKNWQKA